MPEAITKYAVNSTLGTEKFKPLNLLTEDIVVNNDRYGKMFVIGENILIENSGVNQGATTHIMEFIPDIRGQIQVRTYLRDYGYSVRIYENDVVINYYPGSKGEYTYRTINVIPSNVYRIEHIFEGTAGNQTWSIALQADVKQIGYFSITRNE